ncbi:MAG: DUF3179 domain-containing protein [Myxococcota bacterium]
MRPHAFSTLGLAWIVGAALAFPLHAAEKAAGSKNGFDLSQSSVPHEEILHGGPPRDGIPALFEPKMLRAQKAPWDDKDTVVGVSLGGEARAYPIAILSWHELVNDSVAGTPILVSYCPLCGTALVFDREVGGKVRTFGVSGLLYRSDLLLYDRETESLWSQISATSVAGPAMGTRLHVLRSRMTSWGEWKRSHPKSLVLSPETGHQRDYGRDPYAGYATSERLLFPVRADSRYHPKMPTLGVRLPSGAARAYPAVELQRAGGSVQERFEDHDVRVAYDPERQLFSVEAPDAIEVIEGFWFAWAAFHPETTVFVADKP